MLAERLKTIVMFATKLRVDRKSITVMVIIYSVELV